MGCEIFKLILSTFFEFHRFSFHPEISMQILQRLLTNPRSRSKREQCNEEQEVKQIKEGEEEEKKRTVTLLFKREHGRRVFYSLLHLKNPKILYKRNLSSELEELTLKQEAIVVDCKVLPQAVSIDSNEADSQGRRASVSRMKELVRWAASAKAKGRGSKGSWKISYFRNRGASRDPFDDSSSSSSRINFKWGVGSCSTSSSVHSLMSLPTSSTIIDQESTKHPTSPETSEPSSTAKFEECIIRTTQWITTDNDFVVLEL